MKKKFGRRKWRRFELGGKREEEKIEKERNRYGDKRLEKRDSYSRQRTVERMKR